MNPALLGTKIGMTRIPDEKGRMHPVTVVKAGPCTVLQVKTLDSDGYVAVQLGFTDVKPHRSTKPLIGHAAAAGTGPKKVTREVRLAEPSEVSRGDVVTVEQFAEGQVRLVDVSGVTKGKGFSGVMKRHGYGGQQATHGVERKHRSGGSIGGNSNTGTGRGIKKGKPMPGQMGAKNRTAVALELLKVDQENDLLLIRGSVPGPNGSTVFVCRSKRDS